MNLGRRLDRALGTITGGLVHLFTPPRTLPDVKLAVELRKKVENTRVHLQDLRSEESSLLEMIKSFKSGSIEKAKAIRLLLSVRSQIKSVSNLLSELTKRYESLPVKAPIDPISVKPDA